MPLSRPQSGENEQEFISRCMAEIAGEFPDEKQRAAVCYTQWRTAQESTYSYIQQNAQEVNYNIDVKLHMGRKHLVIPVVMMVEGVHNGSAGAILHEAAELAKYPAAWNGIPVLIGHPEDNGRPISANIPEVLEKNIVGRVYNTRFEGEGRNRLVAEAWIDEERIAEISSTALQYIREKKPIDVSVGVFSDDEYVAGRWKDEEYIGIARNYRPDHLALLPNGRGACGWEDGCGVRVNEEGGTMDVKQEEQETKQAEMEEQKEEGGTIVMNEEKVNKVLSFSVFTEQDKEWLVKATPCQLDRLIAMAEKASRKDGVPTPAMNKEQAISVLKEYMADQKQFWQLVPAEYKEQMQYGMRLYEEKRAELTVYIRENTDVYTEDELKAMSFSELEKLAKVVRPKADYSGLASGVNVQTNAYEVEPLLPPYVKQ